MVFVVNGVVLTYSMSLKLTHVFRNNMTYVMIIVCLMRICHLGT
jgi:hypothetical protein